MIVLSHMTEESSDKSEFLIEVPLKHYQRRFKPEHMKWQFMIVFYVLSIIKRKVPRLLTLIYNNLLIY